MDFFDTAGTLTGVSQIAGFLDEEGDLPGMDRPPMADAVGTTDGGMLGASTVTTTSSPRPASRRTVGPG